MNKKVFIMFSIFTSVMVLSGCNNNEPQIDNSIRYDVKEDPKPEDYPVSNFTLIKDFKIFDAVDYAKTFLKKVEAAKDGYGKDISIASVNFRFNYYLGTYNGYKLCEIGYLNFPNLTMYTCEQDTSEKILNYSFEWKENNGEDCFVPRLIKGEECYTLREAFNRNIISENDIKTVYDIWDDKRNEFKLDFTFMQSFSIVEQGK
jgi:hypothetical protein